MTRRTLTTSQAVKLRRTFCLTSLAGALAAVLLITGGGRPPAEAHAATATAGCVKHTKRVVRHVKRHGKRTRVVHLKHYWTCEEVPAASTPAPVATPPVAAPTIPAPTLIPPPVTETAPPVTAPEPEPNALGVAAEDSGGMRYSLSRQTVKSGRLVVQLTDKGEDPHAMDMQRIGPNGEPEGPVVVELASEPGEAGRSTTVEVEPGTYRMWCPIGHHAEPGMEAKLTVE